MDLKTRSTNAIKDLVRDAKENMPENAVNMRLYEEYHTKIGPLGTYHNRTSIDCAYFDKEGNLIKKMEMKKTGSWQFDSDPANYVLHKEGLWKPYDYDTYGHKIKHIKETYENMLNYDMIEPINGITSVEYDCKVFCDKILNDSDKKTLELSFILDYDYAKTRTDIKFKKEEYSIKGKVKYGDEEFEIPHMWVTGIHMLYGKMITKLNEGGFDDIVIHYDMKSEDRKKIFNHLRWADITFH